MSGNAVGTTGFVSIVQKELNRSAAIPVVAMPSHADYMSYTPVPNPDLTPMQNQLFLHDYRRPRSGIPFPEKPGIPPMAAAKLGGILKFGGMWMP